MPLASAVSATATIRQVRHAAGRFATDDPPRIKGGFDSHDSQFSGGLMSGSTARMRAITADCNYQPISPPLNFKETPTKELFGANVFSLSVMKERLPKEVFKSIKKTIDTGTSIDPSIAGVVASAMKDWAIEKGATH